MTTVLFSASPDYYRFAVQELRRRFEVSDHRRVGQDAGVVDLDGATLADVARACTNGEIRFVRHLSEVVAELDGQRTWDDPPILHHAAGADPGGEDPVAVQVWATHGAPGGHESLLHRVKDALADRGRTVRRARCPQVLAICLGETRTIIGRSPSEHALSDWPGGRIRLAARSGQVSRAEFKIEEVLSLIPVEVRGRALDLGAAPGGWTKILLQRGCEHVDAVDPGSLDPRVTGLAGVTVHRTTAGEFLRAAEAEYDLIVNDMRMDPRLSIDVMVQAADHLAPGGSAIMTLKLTPNRAVERVDQAIESLSAAYRVRFARQLQHNRNEVTIVATARY